MSPGGRIRRRLPPAAACLVTLLAALLAAAQGARAAGVELFSPRGEARDVRQVAVRFTEAMVALGDPRLPAPFVIECSGASAAGSGRWVDPRNWTFDFAQPLPAGVRCTARRAATLRTLGGAALDGAREHRFDTGGPAIRASHPREGWQIDSQQVFILSLDGAADAASVAAGAACAVENVGERIPVEVLEGGAREEVLAQRRALGYAYFRVLRESSAETAPLSASELQAAERELVVLRCRRNLPADTAVQLVWGRGIRSSVGIATRQDQVLAFRTRPAFTVRVECERVNPEAGCLPMRPLRVVFSSPVPRALAKVQLADASGVRYAAEHEQPRTTSRRGRPVGGRSGAGAGERSETLEQIVFPGPFPERAALSVSIDPALADDAARAPENAARFPLQVTIDEYPPLVKFAGNFGILESGTGGVLPVTVRNVEPQVMGRQLTTPESMGIGGRSLRVPADKDIAGWLRRIEEAMRPRGEWREEGTGADGRRQGRWVELTGSTSVFEVSEPLDMFAVPKPGGPGAFEVVGIPLQKKGFYVVELFSPRLGAALLGPRQRRHVATAALVTNLAVHFKWGREASQVWVTRLDTGRPVAGVALHVSGFCTGATLWRGESGADGTARIDAPLGEPHGSDSCNSWAPQPLMVSARSGDDMSFTLSAWSAGIAPSDFSLPESSEHASRVAHSVLDRTLLRAGETVSMKHFVRRRTSAGFEVPAAGTLPDRLVVAHVGSGQRYVLDVRFDAAGVAESTWPVPIDARLGEYTLTLERRRVAAAAGRNDGEDAEDALESGRFRVEQFRLPTMRAVIQPPAAPQVRPAELPFDLHLAHLSGGAAANAPVKLRTLVEPRSVRVRSYAEFSFGGEEIREGVVEPNEGDDAFWLYSMQRDGEGGSSAGAAAQVQVQALTLDANGGARVIVRDLPEVAQPASLLAELEYEDANGERLTSTARVPLWPAALQVGIKVEGWAATPQKLRLQAVALDLQGAPLAGRVIEVDAFQRESYSYRRRLIGGFYAYEQRTEVTRIEAACSERSDARGFVTCELAPGVSGQVLLRARARDADGRVASASASAWVVDGEEWWFDPGNADRMDVLPERKEYRPGETARLQVRMPFRSATALVTVEREGVMESFVTRLSGRNPVVEVPMRGAHAPNVFVSVLAVRGRVQPKPAWLPFARDEAVEPTALVDLSKPAFRLGAAQLRVGWDAHRLEVTAKPAREVYKVRERAALDVAVRRADGSALPAGSEVALAVVDESLLELSANRSWALLDAMMGERGTEVWTSTAAMQVVGKRHYGRKAVPAGGGGGRAPARELFDTLVAWKGRVPLDGQGRARIEVPLNDSLSAFRVVAIASGGTSGGAGFFGTGEATLRTSQDLMLQSGLAPLVRETDRYAAYFTVRNASQRAMTVDVGARHAQQALEPRTVTLAPGASAQLSWTVTAPLDIARLEWEASAREQGGAAASDALRVSQQVIPAWPVRTYQATLAQLSTPLTVRASLPAGAMPGRGGVDVQVLPSLAAQLGGVREYMSWYPYACTEQRLSVAVALRDRRLWEAQMARLPALLDQDGFLRFFPLETLAGSDVLTAYVLAVGHEAGWEIPEETRERMLAALAGFVTGRLQRDSALPTADLAIRKLAALEALSRHGAAQAAMLDSIAIDPGLWPTSAVLDWMGVLQRVKEIPGARTKLDTAAGIVRSRLNFQGTTMSFSTERRDALWWLMVSGDVNATRAILTLLNDAVLRRAWREDLPRLVRGTLSRQKRGHWDTTTANAWGVLALEKFGAAFEATPVTGATRARWSAAGDAPRSVELEARRTSGGGEGDAPDAGSRTSFPWPGTAAATLEVAHTGAGAPWAIVRSQAALPLQQAISGGFGIRRRVSAVEQRAPGSWSVGDVVRVSLDVEAQADMAWVVVDDPVPAGATLLGSGLGRDSALLAAGEQRRAAVQAAYEERRFDAFRAYYAFVPQGRFTVEYTLRLNTAGRFVLPASRVEAMYAPEMYGELPNAALEVRAAGQGAP